MNPQVAVFESTNPVYNITLTDAQKVQMFAAKFGLTSALGAVQVNREPSDPITPYAQFQPFLQPEDKIRFVIQYDRFYPSWHEAGAQWALLHRQAAADQILREFVADIADTVSTNNPNAGVDQEALLSDMLGSAAAPAIADAFKVLK